MTAEIIRIGIRWQLTLPPGWSSQSAPNSTALFKMDGGVGAVTVSSMRSGKHASINPVDVVEEFALSLRLSSRGPCEQVATPPHCIAAAEGTYEKDGQRWVVHVVVADRAMLLLSYNCGADNWEREQTDVRRIMASVVERH